MTAIRKVEEKIIFYDKNENKMNVNWSDYDESREKVRKKLQEKQSNENKRQLSCIEMMK